MKLRQALGVSSLIALTGCASVVNETTHPMKVEVLRSDGRSVAGADCTLSNDYGTVSVRSGATTQVRRSSKDLDLSCKNPTGEDAHGRAISRANAGMAGNILFGGGIGAIIDHNKGTAYTYPTWVQLQFGKSLVFDRSNEKEGMPVLASALPGSAPGLSQAGSAVETTEHTDCIPHGYKAGDTLTLRGLGPVQVKQISAVNTQCGTNNSPPVQAVLLKTIAKAAGASSDIRPVTINATETAAAAKLRALNDLLRDGLITQPEFEAKKAEILRDL